MNETGNSFPKIDEVKRDPHSPIPLYHRTYLKLRDLILNQGLKPGDMLPSETLLAQKLNVGRQTIRTAMSQLVDDGLVERFSGKGTFLSEPQTRNAFFLDRSFSQEMEELGKKASARVLTLKLDVIKEYGPKCFQKFLGASCLHLTRLRFGDDIPIGLQESIILTERCKGLEKHDFTKESLFQIFAKVYGLSIYEIYHIVNAVISDETYASLLGIKAGDPLLLEKSVTYLSDGYPIEATTSHFRADQYEYSVRFRYMGSKRI